MTGLDRRPTRPFRKEGHVPAERLSMRKLREFLRLHLEHHLTGRAIGRSLTISPATAQSYMARVRLAALAWPLPPELEFRSMPITDSDACRSLVPIQADHRFRSMPIAERLSRFRPS